MANSIDGQSSILSVVGPLATSPGALKLVFEALLSTEPWLHDPLVHEIPWRPETETLPKKLSFGVIRHDGACTVHPPVARAIDMAVKAMEKLGHQVIEWTPTPKHVYLHQICEKVWNFDGGADCVKDFELSGEEPSPVLMFGPGPQANASEIMAVNLAKREAQKEYMEYWNSTAALTNTGRPVDAVIAPLAPFSAARQGGYTYYAYSSWVNLLDYTGVTIPVTQVDKNVDKKIENFQPVSEVDQKTQDTYDPEIYDGAHVSIQLVGRRLQEEKMLALAKYVGDAL